MCDFCNKKSSSSLLIRDLANKFLNNIDIDKSLIGIEVLKYGEIENFKMCKSCKQSFIRFLHDTDFTKCETLEDFHYNFEIILCKFYASEIC